MIFLSCTSPIYRVDTSRTFLPPELRLGEVNGGVIFGKDEYSRFVSLVGENAIQALRCGSCIDCRLNASHKWAVRCMFESQYHENSIFLTLTYSDPFLPRGNFVDHTGEVFPCSLSLSDIQAFFKRLRERLDRLYGSKVRIFYCGEYGELNHRPHYHAIIFGFPSEARLDFEYSRDGFNYYTSPDIEACWCDRSGVSIGFHVVSDFSYDTAAYTSRYIMKKQKGKSLCYLATTYPEGFSPLVNPFAHMSSRPGLGYLYFKEHKDEIYTYDSIYYLKDFQVFKSKPPRYFDKLFDLENHSEFELLRSERQKLANLSRGQLMSQVSEDYFDRLSRQDGIAERKEKKRFFIL